MAAPAAAAAAPAAADLVEAGARGAGKAAYAGGSALARCTRACCDAFGGCIKKLHPETVAILLRIINIGNSVVLGFACYFAYTLVGPTDVTRAFLATYIGVFATLLLLFETRVKWTSKWIRRNFGFLFTYSGRTIFLIFLGAVCFGMLDESQKHMNGYTWCLVTGLATVCNALFNCFIICNHPGFQEMNRADTHAAPAGADPSKMSDAQIRAYLEAHPEVAARVATGAEGGAAVASDEVSVSVAGEDWASGAGKAKGSAASGSGGMFGGIFGGGKNKGASPTSEAAAATFTGEVKSSDSGYTPPYIPPAVPAAAPLAAPAPYEPPFGGAAPAYAPPAAAAGSSGGGNFAIADDDNPFAASDNPYAGK